MSKELLIISLLFFTSLLWAEDKSAESPAKKTTVINADTLNVNNQERKFVYEGNVEVVQDDLNLKAKILEGTYNENNEIQTLVAKNSVVITKGTDIQARSERADYDSKSELLVLTESPELQQKESILVADKVKIYLEENRSEAEGDVRVKMISEEKQPDVNRKGKKKK